MCDPISCLLIGWGFLCYSYRVYKKHTETYWKKYLLNLLIQKEVSSFLRVKFLHQHLYSCNRKPYPHNVSLIVGGESMENPKDEENSILEVICLLYIKS